jgi:hypothetical protein
MVIERLGPGSFHGCITKSLRVADFILTESEFDPYSRLPRHAHKTRISVLRCRASIPSDVEAERLFASLLL